MEYEKYYASTPLVAKKTEELDPERGHQHYNDERLTGQIQGVFTAVQPLHVGTGLYVPPALVGIQSDVPLLKSFHQVDGRLTVPGSSLKGPLRSFVEAVTHSCVSKVTGKTKSKLDKQKYGECEFKSKGHWGQLCPACKIFGAMGYQGQVWFADAPLIDGSSAVQHIPPQHQPKGDQARRHYPHALVDGRDPAWPLEVAAPGSRFSFHIRFQNLDEAELGLLLLALGLGEPPLCLKLGAGKSSGLGMVRFSEVRVEKLDVAELYSAYESSAAWQPVDPATVLKEKNNLLRADMLSRWQRELGCPEESR